MRKLYAGYVLDLKIDENYIYCLDNKATGVSGAVIVLGWRTHDITMKLDAIRNKLLESVGDAPMFLHICENL